MGKRDQRRSARAAAQHTGGRTGPADFSAPWEFTALDIAFPTETVAAMPVFAEMADYSRRFEQLFYTWFYDGLASIKATPKPGIDAQRALAHIRFIMGGFDSKHEHKEAAVCFLLDKWFESIEWTPKARER